MSHVEIKPEVASPRVVVVQLEWFPDQNIMNVAVSGGDSMHYRGMLVKAMNTLEQIEAGAAKPNRVQIARGPLPRRD